MCRGSRRETATLRIRDVMSRIEIAIANGADVWLLSWISRTSRSIVTSVLDPSNPVHITYHKDGRVHIKALKGEPLKNDQPIMVPIVGVGSVVRNENGKAKSFWLKPLAGFYGIQCFYWFPFSLNRESMECLPKFGQSRRKPDAVFYIDKRCFRSNVVAVEFGIMSPKYPLSLTSLDEPCSGIYYFFTQSSPWIVISIREEMLVKH